MTSSLWVFSQHIKYFYACIQGKASSVADEHELIELFPSWPSLPWQLVRASLRPHYFLSIMCHMISFVNKHMKRNFTKRKTLVLFQGELCLLILLVPSPSSAKLVFLTKCQEGQDQVSVPVKSQVKRIRGPDRCWEPDNIWLLLEWWGSGLCHTGCLP